MIFVTVGTQLAFPRLIAAMDHFAAGCDEPIVAQVGPDVTETRYLDRRLHLDPAAFTTLFVQARVVVAHAGIGTILSARQVGRPLVLVPRRHALGEHRNDHQMATARQVAALPGVHIAWEEGDLVALLDPARTLEPPVDGASPTHAALVARLRAFMEA
ncbi:MAG: glycosyltransferase [Jannaschia sp.]